MDPRTTDTGDTEYTTARPAAPQGQCQSLTITPTGSGFAVTCDYGNGQPPAQKTAASVDELVALVQQEFAGSQPGSQSPAPPSASPDIATERAGA
jgi:hypothetical protein